MLSWQKKGEWLELVLPETLESAQELKKYIHISDGYLSKLKNSGGLAMKGTRARLRLFPNESLQDMTDWYPLEVLFEDDFCLVANKPASMKVHGDGQQDRCGKSTLADAVASYYAVTGQHCKVRHIHRLDENTTGPVLYAKHEWSQLVLDEAMRSKSIERTYVALVEGHPAVQSGIIDAPIGRDRHHASRRRASQSGEHAVTHYEVVEHLKDAALMRLRLETGRTHQIRVHLSHIGHPIVGDALYGGALDRFTRQALHGEKLSFAHPLTGRREEVGAPWPADMLQLYTALQKI
ncbi:RluA family pseudouridine synthase [Paenibacillus xerothermodurans]|uniref:Pseudouridine synthase n=1 Tax=Paenibacillus xerothermodurans TaxID=1977292 RepID=A0A2W1NLX6_PAEXE|nr:RluA family pseudouridine synthase [Paenibacillus xerothermodurans]PZE19963.1 RluA family pseudouridine synthase [Paenibacillus xerothermodurans]